jgi:hypothetical protein
LVVGHHDLEHQSRGGDHDDDSQPDLDRHVASAASCSQVIAWTIAMLAVGDL